MSSISILMGRLTDGSILHVCRRWELSLCLKEKVSLIGLSLCLEEKESWSDFVLGRKRFFFKKNANVENYECFKKYVASSHKVIKKKANP